MRARRAAVCAAALCATGCKTRLLDEPLDFGSAPALRDQSVVRDLDAPIDAAIAADRAAPEPLDLAILTDLALPDDLPAPVDLAPPADLRPALDLATGDAFTCPGIFVAPDPIDFQCSATVTFQISNLCNGALKITAITIGGADPGEFILGMIPGLPVTLGPQTSFPVELDFVPQQAGVRTASIDISGSAPSLSVPVRAGPPTLRVSPQGLDFGKEPVGSSTAPSLMLLSDDGTCPLHLKSLTVAGANPGDFTVSGPFPNSLAPGASFSLPLIFTPTAAGPRSATLTFDTDDPHGLFSAVLTGTGS